MNRAFELPGEANPLTPSFVYSALQSAGSNQQQQIQSGTAQLQTWEKQPGYYSLLQVRHASCNVISKHGFFATIIATVDHDPVGRLP